jgi:hypothetical protein
VKFTILATGTLLATLAVGAQSATAAPTAAQCAAYSSGSESAQADMLARMGTPNTISYAGDNTGSPMSAGEMKGLCKNFNNDSSVTSNSGTTTIAPAKGTDSNKSKSQ